MLREIINKPIYIGCIYLLCIPIFASIYYFYPEFWVNPLTAVESLYFSTVTITTLGYGDITPKTEVARILAATESIIGIVTIGFFLNAVAQSAALRREFRQKTIAKEHLVAQYREWREDIVRACLRAKDPNRAVQSDLEAELVNFQKFRKFFLENNRVQWYKVLNGMQNNPHVVEEIYFLSELFSQQITIALGKIATENKDSLMILTRVSQKPRLLQSLDMYKSDPVKYLGSHLLETLAMCDTVSGKMEEDFIEKAIIEL